jgi:bacillithiol biosynthesis cysteine-adding enzyme BshC
MQFASACGPDHWMDRATRAAVVGLLTKQNLAMGAGTETLANLGRLADGANAVVTGQQVGLFGGPLMTLAKAATAVRRAEDASRAGHPHVPIFWMASEDHDLAEVDHVLLPGKDSGLHPLRLKTPTHHAVPVGNIPLGGAVRPLLDELQKYLGDGDAWRLLADAYTPENTYAGAFGRLLHHLFARHGLIVIDASTRDFHALARPVLRAAIEQAAPLREALQERTRTLESSGHHAQVLVTDTSSLLFLLDEKTGARHALKQTTKEMWAAGNERYHTKDLLAILDSAPERISPSALLRPVMQDALLPTSAYIGGPAEIAYFAQSQVVYERVLGRVTPVLPRLSITLVEHATARLLEHYGLAITDIFHGADELAQRLAARSLPVEGKRRLAATGDALEQEINGLLAWMEAQDVSLGHAARTAASKMRYQMGRLRRLAANFALQRENKLRRHAEMLQQHLFPSGHLQDRVLAGAWFLRLAPEGLVPLLVEHAHGRCPGNLIVPL